MLVEIVIAILLLGCFVALLWIGKALDAITQKIVLSAKIAADVDKDVAALSKIVYELGVELKKEEEDPESMSLFRDPETGLLSNRAFKKNKRG